jgi:hypothetical protein
MDSGLWLLIGVVIGVFCPLIARKLYEFNMRPQIKIEKDVPMKESKAFSHSIKVTNCGKTAIKNCIGLLTISNLERADVLSHGFAFLQPDYYRDVIDEPLCWSFQTYNPVGKLVDLPYINIHPNSSALLDLCRVVYDNAGSPSYVEVPSEAGWDMLRAKLRGDKEYEVELKVNAENVVYNRKKHSVKITIDPVVRDAYELSGPDR